MKVSMEPAKPSTVVQIRKKRVLVFGAGVAGLTVAHELAERGFKVCVIESEEDPRQPFRPQIGGMAATQWSRLPFKHEIGSSAEWPKDGRMFRAPAQPCLQDLHPSQAKLPRAMASPWPELYFACNSAEVDLIPNGCSGVAKSQPKPPDLPSPAARINGTDGIADRIVSYLREVKDLVEQGAFGTEPFQGDRALEVIYLDATVSPSEAGGVGFADERGAIEAPGLVRDLSALRAVSVAMLLLAALRSRLGEGWTFEYTEPRPLRDLVILFTADGTKWPIARIVLRDLGNAHDVDRTRHDWQKRYVQIGMQPRGLPGEHGYRLFPRFYRHLLDTLRRTPVPAISVLNNSEVAKRRKDDTYQWWNDKKYDPTGRSVFDNLIPVTEQDFACSGNERPRELPRFRGEGVSDLLDFLRLLQEDMGWDMADVQLAQLRFLQYASSSTTRRQEMEDLSWIEFLEGSGPDKVRFSQAFLDSMGHWPQALIGLRAEKIDARTFGSTALQQFIDQLQPLGYRDGTLNGPTTTSWLDHWQRYLESLGVEFYLGRLSALEIDAENRVLPKVDWPKKDETKPVEDNKLIAFFAPSSAGAAEPDPPIYVVLALPVEKMWCLVQALPEPFDDIADVEAIRRQLDVSNDDPFCLTWLGTKELKGPLAHFAGIQFFLDEDYRFLDGHVYYPESSWGLTSISQSQFRSDQAETRFRYRGLVSVVIGDWETPGSHVGKSAWECSDEELAIECWRQMCDGFGSPQPRMPRWFHVDRNIRRTDESTPSRRNDSPYLTLEPGRFRGWPGEPGEYKVHLGNLVFAGTYMKTHTRLVTMESANESGRHAANAILRHWSNFVDEAFFAGAEIWTLEDQEPRDLQFLKRIDEKLHAEGLPHAFDILGLGKIVEASAGEGCGHPSSLVEALARVAASQGRGLTAVVEGLRRLVGVVPNPWW